MIPKKDQIKRYLQKITASRYFERSKISCDLLTYLVESTLKGQNPKEYTIGIELFGKKYESDSKQDSNIRVYIHNIRKRLSEYYDHEGRKDEIHFEIEKGKYRVNFISSKDKKHRGSNYLVPFVISSVLLTALVIFMLANNRAAEKTWSKSALWSGFNNGKKTLLVLGDYFVFNGFLPTGSSGIFRDFKINSEKEFKILLSEKPELAQTLSKSHLTYLSKMAVFCQNDIQRVFGYLGENIEVKLSSDMQPDDLKFNNVIFIGNYKNMGIFESLISEMEFPYNIKSPYKDIILSQDPCSAEYQASSHDEAEVDYSLVLSFSGFNKNRFLFFLSSQDIGNISTVGIFTREKSLKEFEEKYLRKKETPDFKALYKVQGINKTDLSYELLRVD